MKRLRTEKQARRQNFTLVHVLSANKIYNKMQQRTIKKTRRQVVKLTITAGMAWYRLLRRLFCLDVPSRSPRLYTAINHASQFCNGQMQHTQRFIVCVIYISQHIKACSHNFPRGHKTGFK